MERSESSTPRDTTLGRVQNLPDPTTGAASSCHQADAARETTPRLMRSHDGVRVAHDQSVSSSPRLITTTATARPAFTHGLFARFQRPSWPRTRLSLTARRSATSGAM